ncbi:MAG: EAL domain-containing protein [Motiliproteus sp.]
MNFRQSKAIAAIMQSQLISCPPSQSLLDVSRLMRQHNCSSVVIIDNEIPVGIWTESDALQLDFRDPDALQAPIQTVMSTPVKTIDQQLTIDEAAHTFKQQGIRHLLVLNDKKTLCGILSQSDVVRHQDAEYFLYMHEVESILADTPPLQIPHSSSLEKAISMMRGHQTDCIVITNRDQPVGLLTQRDLIRLIAENKTASPLLEVISKPLICVPANMTLLSARSLMARRSIRHLGVKDRVDNLKGLISFSDILSNIEYAYVNRLKDALESRAADLAQSAHNLNMANALIDASMDGIMVTDAKGVIQSINPAFTILTGYSEQEALGKNASLISSGKQPPEFYASMWQQIDKSGSWQGEIWNRRKSGEIFPEWLTITAVRDHHNQRTLYAGIFSDITERKKSEAIIENLAYYDPLTKLPNRQLLFDRMDVALATAHRDGSNMAVIFADLDHFKRINDSLGHTAGDQVLREVAERMRSCVREGDTLSRIGGDEFVMLLTEMDSIDVAYRLAQRITESLKQPIIVDGHELHISTSMGCSTYPQDGNSRNTLLKNADTAMYRAKQSGRNVFHHYCAKMNDKSMRRLNMETRLRAALSKNEFFIHYQPKVDLHSNKIAGVEALLRWQDEELGTVPPTEFIKLAEDLGLINDIGRWVLQQACQQCRRWIDSGAAPLQISVNVSAQQFLRGTLIQEVSEALTESRLPAHLLDLEITESCLIKDPDSVADTLTELRYHGVTISMDDFGTGYSSLSLLKRFPLDYLKIDRSFMEGIPDDSDNAELVSTIILMAHNLRLKVIAEGVENAEQMKYLKTLNCDQIQGFYYSLPLPPEDIEALILNQEALC